MIFERKNLTKELLSKLKNQILYKKAFTIVEDDYVFRKYIKTKKMHMVKLQKKITSC